MLIIIFYVFRQDFLFKPYHYYRSLSANIETIQFTIQKKQFQTLDSLCNDVLKKRKVNAYQKPYVKAVAFYNNDTIKVKIRLKGDQLDHYEFDPPLYRVKQRETKLFWEQINFQFNILVQEIL